jgi:cellulose synthase/poly-beta-1,6-N-acetylglucosamine synthase-like glycosyltransferase
MIALTLLEAAVVGLYAFTLMLLFTYNCGQLSLIIIYLRTQHKRRALRATAEQNPDTLPFITVQLPIYNERYVVERLIDQVVKLRYPTGKIEIQVLDDSTDDSVALISAQIADYQRQGINIQHIRRPGRIGFKAGALAYGLTLARGEFIAIFDADFMPEPDFLLKTVPHFADANVGIVQTRWTHLNEQYSILTQLQGFGLNAHFFVEQGARNSGDLFMNFNGTAGVWRKTTIADAGGWSNDTLTEDLDLSYRAQLRGWKFVYREDIGSPAELPVQMNAFKSQQYRWMKGAAECARKLIGRVFWSPGVPLANKIHAVFHLFSSSTFIMVFVLGVLSVPLLYVRNHHTDWSFAYGLINFFQYNLLILITFYGVPYWMSGGRNPARFAWYFPMYSALMMGMSLHNTIAVIEGYIGKRTPFVRTPKFNVMASRDSWAGNVYLTRKLGPLTIAEGVLLLYFVVGGIGLAVWLRDFQMLFFHAMLIAGFGMVFGYALAQVNE